MTPIPLPCPICERPAKRSGGNIACPHCALTWAAECTPNDGAGWPGDLALSRYLVEGYHANLWRAEQAAEGAKTWDELAEATRHLLKAADYFVLIQGAVR